MKIVNNLRVDVVKFRTLNSGDVFMIQRLRPSVAVFIRTDADLDEDGNAIDISDGKLWGFGPDEEVIPLPDAYMCIR